jgi:CO/xanthine dehydrogenase Mo-binding subunit
MSELDIVGQNANRTDAVAKVTGAALYPGDLIKANMLHMKVLFARCPHAIVKSIDTAEAEQVSGVVAIYTAKDVPNNEYGLIMPDQPVLIGPGSNKPWGDHVRFIGDQVAIIVAESEKIAERARDLIVVEYKDLPILTDPRAAMKDGAEQLHLDKPNNILQHFRVRKGNVDSIWKKCDVIVESEYHTPFQEHAFLQPEAGLAYIDEQSRITVEVGGQWTSEDQEQIAHALRLPKDQIRVIYPAIGGAFGGREDMSVQIILALAVWKLQRPVKIIWSREESMIGHHKRHPMALKAKWGARKDGKLLAAQIEVIADAGAYAYTSTKVQGNTTLTCTGPYEIPNVKVDTYTVFTNNIPTGAFRGFGGPQGEFEAEMQMNKLAEKLGMDPVELRLKNVLREGSILSVGAQIPKGVSIAQVLEQCALEVGWKNSNLAEVEGKLSMPSIQPPQGLTQGWIRPPKTSLTNPHKRVGLGLTIGFKNVGFSFGAVEKSDIKIELRGATEIEEAIVYHGAAEVGQGTHTVIRQMAARALDLPIEKVKLIMSDTATSGNPGSVSASRMTFMVGNSIKGAAEIALKKWAEEERPAIAEYAWLAPKTTPYDPETGKSEPNFAYGYVAQAVEVEVDIETGHVRVLRVWSANDVGHAINPELVRGQIEGGIIQAQGYAVLENFQMKDGQVLTPYLSNYLIPTVLDVPQEINSIILEYPDPLGPWGARGMAEMPYLPFAPAVCAAVKDAIGIWIDSFPLTPDRVLKAIKVH